VTVVQLAPVGVLPGRLCVLHGPRASGYTFKFDELGITHVVTLLNDQSEETKARVRLHTHHARTMITMVMMKTTMMMKDVVWCALGRWSSGRPRGRAPSGSGFRCRAHRRRRLRTFLAS
jgi:hypothetical protein